MGGLLSQLVGKLLGDPPPPSIESEIDPIFICCGTMNVTEMVAREGTTEEEKESTQ